jgi:hypothetical protein
LASRFTRAACHAVGMDLFFWGGGEALKEEGDGRSGPYIDRRKMFICIRGLFCGGMGLTWAACAAHDADVYLDDLPLMQERVKGLAWGLEDFKGHGCFTVW